MVVPDKGRQAIGNFGKIERHLPSRVFKLRARRKLIYKFKTILYNYLLLLFIATYRIYLQRLK